MTPAHLTSIKYRADQYERARLRLQARRDLLREAVELARAHGVTVVAIAEILGWSRQSVYDLMKG